MHGTHYIKSWSKTQALVALSSAESELYAIVKASSETLGVMSILQDMNKMMKSVLLSDASAALGVVQRQGLGVQFEGLPIGFGSPLQIARLAQGLGQTGVEDGSVGPFPAQGFVMPGSAGIISRLPAQLGET